MRIPRKERKAPKINTTALPDIIFMLLFFFMVTTTIQTNSSDYLELPTVKHLDTQIKEKPDELLIYLGKKQGAFHMVVNGYPGDFDDLDRILSAELSKQKKKGILKDKAILWIDFDIPMSLVNDLKEALQENEVYSIEYVHLADHSS